MTSFPRSKKVKLDWFPFYARDWISDPCLMATSPSTQGMWIRMLCLMFIEGRCELTGDLSALASWGGGPGDIDVISTFLADAKLYQFADITECNSSDEPIYTIRSRRLAREQEEREKTRQRVREWRERQSGNSVVTAHGNGPVTGRVEYSKSREEKNITNAPAPPGFDFEEFWKLYPRREHRQGAERSWGKLKANEQQAAMVDIPKRRRANWDGREIKHIPHAATYLNQRQWLDELVSPGAVNSSVSPYGPPKPRELVAPISQEQRLENVRRLRELTAGITRQW